LGDKRARFVDPKLRFERLLWGLGYQRVAGVDEAGLGPFAGPVVAAAVVFPSEHPGLPVDDSKKLSARRREGLADEIHRECLDSAIGVVDVQEIDSMGVHRAGLEAMRRAVSGLQEPADYVLVDAREVPGIEAPQSGWVKGDSFIHCVAAASILAKVHRDALMEVLDCEYPSYGFARHKGYGTALHLEALRQHGPCAAHRRSFEPIRRILAEKGD
jgi:ribonuclease HII